MMRAKSVSKVLVLKIKRLPRVSFASPSSTRRCVSVADCRLSVAVSVGSPTHERTLSRLSVAVAVSVGSPTHERTSLLAIVLPFLFQRFTILVLESASFCSSIERVGFEVVARVESQRLKLVSIRKLKPVKLSDLDILKPNKSFSNMYTNDQALRLPVLRNNGFVHL
ncbi:putative galacturonosyltransferase 15 isoform X1 [Senna tora]|uniref:Putative galacturonosyltransferase 15 isoform X1 n=1 Tax=Senna tora TaxID=362788 RepID=A0A834SY37_9FABA|nr:putative galacturonosyltransferase 15 isoform X1 [Senna tora]